MLKTFARRHRLTKTDEFSSVFGFRRAVRGQLLMLHFLPKPEGEARLGLVVGKKQLKKAVDRNTLKRVIREQFRHCRHELPAADLVVRLMSKPPSIDKKLFAEDFVRLVKKFRHNNKKSRT